MSDSPLRRLWQHVYGDERGYVCVSAGTRTTPATTRLAGFKEQFYAYPDTASFAEIWLEREAALAKRETYTCAHLLTRQQRTKANAAPVLTLFADLDGAPPPNGALTPTAVVQSSPDRLQAYWRLTRPLPPDEAEALNKRLTYHIGADESGWDLTQLLRPPGMPNRKRATETLVEIVYIHDDARVDPDELDRLLPPAPDETASPADDEADAAQRSQTITDAELLVRALSSDVGDEIRQLLRGHQLRFASPSQADGALAMFLTFWSQDVDQVERVMRGSERARAKWDERRGADTWLRRDIGTAINKRAATGNFWNGSTRTIEPPDQPHQHLEDDELGDDHGSGDMDDDSPTARELPERRLTDLGNGERLADHFGDRLRYVETWKSWLIFDGGRWALDETGRVVQAAKQVVRRIHQEADRFTGDDQADKRKAIFAHAARSEGRARVDAMMTLAATEREIAATPAEFDRDPWLLNCRNGTLDLRTGELRAHDRADLITKICPVVYDPQASAPTWDAFLTTVMAGNTALIGFLQRAIGYSLTGDTSERKLFIGHGVGRNGKSTLLETLRELLGDYAIRTPTETLMAHRDNTIPNDVARLRGARFVYASEAEEGRRLAESFVKDVTGGDTISARFMRAEWFDFTPVCKLWLATNHRPVIRGTDEAIWDRISLIKFDVRIPDADLIPRRVMAENLRRELPGILAWAVRGCLDWQRDGLGEPPEVATATAGYRADMDILAQFIDEHCIVMPGLAVRAQAVYRRYTMWCDDAGERPISQTAFSLRLAERGYTKSRTMTGVHWHGIGLVQEPSPDA